MELILCLIIIIYLISKVGSDRSAQNAAKKATEERLRKEREIRNRITDQEFEYSLDVDEYSELITKSLLEIFGTSNINTLISNIVIDDTFKKRIILSQYGIVLYWDTHDVFSGNNLIKCSTFDYLYKYYKWIESELNKRGVKGSYQLIPLYNKLHSTTVPLDLDSKKVIKHNADAMIVEWVYEN